MILHKNISALDIRTKIRYRQITFGGNIKLKIYGKLCCKSGKKLKSENRIFFLSEHEAILAGYRPCGHCMKPEYKSWKMKLFELNTVENILPEDGIVNYYGKILTEKEAGHYMQSLLNNIIWKNDEAVIFGRHIITKRKVAWYGDQGFSYTYSNRTRHALPWTKELLKLKTLIEEKSGEKYNSCLLNLYHNGEEGMGWHSDDEKEMIKNAAIASLSLGAERRFLFRHKVNKQTISLQLENGSLLVMKGTTQSYWQHSIPKSTRILLPRINLTFRIFKNPD